MSNAVDSTLKLGWDRYNNKPKGTDVAAFSHSLGSQFIEDPHKFYLKKIKGHKEPKSVPLAFGIAAHDSAEEFSRARFYNGLSLKKAALEAFAAAEDQIDNHWGDIPNPTERINPYEPESPRGRQEISLPADKAKEKVRDMLWTSFCNIEDFAGTYSIFAAQHNPQALEISIGELAEQNGRAHTSIYCYNFEHQRKMDKTVALIAGVPVRGKIDLLADWPGGGQVIIDHKAVSKVVAYYPPYNGQGPWKQYDPSYDPASSFQLSLYALASGVPRAGFQFMLRRPQYIPPNGVLYEGWKDEREYSGEGLPSAIVKDDKGRGVHVCVWRPPTGPFSLDSIRQSTESRLRHIAEELTVSITLYQNGVEPEIAFPAGDPDEIARKACPYCFFGPEHSNTCMAPRKDTATSRKAYKEAMRKRSQIAADTPEIRELRSHWKQYR